MSTGGEEVRKLSTGMPLSAEAVEFSPTPAREQHRQAGRRNMAVGNSRNKPTQVEELGVRFTAMAEVQRPPSTEDEGEILAQRSGQQVIGNAYSGRNPVMSSAPRGGMLFRGPETYPAQMRVLDGIPMEEVECLEPLSILVPDAPLDSRPMAGNRMRNSPDVAIYEKNTTGRPMEGVTSPTPWRRSVTLSHLDSQPSGYKSMPDQSKDPISEDIPQRQEKPPDSKTVSCRNTDKAVRRAPSGLKKPFGAVSMESGIRCKDRE